MNKQNSDANTGNKIRITDNGIHSAADSNDYDGGFLVLITKMKKTQ